MDTIGMCHGNGMGIILHIKNKASDIIRHDTLPLLKYPQIIASIPLGKYVKSIGSASNIETNRPKCTSESLTRKSLYFFLYAGVIVWNGFNGDFTPLRCSY